MVKSLFNGRKNRMSESCCRTTNEGNAVCILPTPEKAVGCGCSSQPESDTQVTSPSAMILWQKIRGGVMFGLACLTSPCCTPLIVPLGLAFIAGTPVAAWLTHYIGWIYGGLTLVSIISLVLGWRWLRQKTSPQQSPSTKKPVPENRWVQGIK